MLAHHNLRFNPFGAPAEHERGGLTIATVDVDALVARLRAGGFAVQLVGAPGWGKSSQLHALHARARTMPLVRLRGPCTRLKAAPILFVDEAQWLGRGVARQLAGGRTSLVLATHRDDSRRLRRAGFEVRTLRIASLSPPQLDTYVRRRLAWARRGPGPLPVPPPTRMATLHDRHGDDTLAGLPPEFGLPNARIRWRLVLHILLGWPDWRGSVPLEANPNGEKTTRMGAPVASELTYPPIATSPKTPAAAAPAP